MRMDQSHGTTAAELVNYTAEKALADLIYQLGEERRARKIARAIVRARPIRSTRHLADVVERAAYRTGRLHPATQTFMALRMAVNDGRRELAQTNPYLLRALPNEDIFFYTKRVDNSRLVREPDPRAKSECWSSIGAICAIAAVLITSLVPGVAGITAGYQVEALKQERV